MPAGDQVRVPRLLSRERSLWISVAAAGVGVLGVMVWAVLTQPLLNQLCGLVACVVLAVLLGFLLGRRTTIDTARGVVVRDVVGLLPRRVAWAEADQVRFTNNRAGTLLLEVRGAGDRTSVYLPLVAVDHGGDRSQDPAFLRLLADQVETWAPQRRAVVDGLRAEAEHLGSGGSVRESPLARRYLARSR